MLKIKTIVILGPTSSGKSDLAVDLAKKLEKKTGKKSEIISADSRQIYKDMDLGTGKIEGQWSVRKNSKNQHKQKIFQQDIPQEKNKSTTNSELSNLVFTYKNVPHHLIDFINPKTHSSEENKYSVINFQQDALKLIKSIAKQGRIPIICGGTGFWISALVDNVQFPRVKPNEKLRIKLKEKSVEELFATLKEKDPKRAKSIDRQNKHRLIRALEICEELGGVPTAKVNPVENIEFLQIGLDWPIEKLEEKIKKRLEGRWTDGMIDEVKILKEKYQLSWEDIQKFGLAYHWIPLYLQKKLTDSQGKLITNSNQLLEELKKRVYFAEKKYAKRQQTWFKRDQRIIWETEPVKILGIILKFLK